MNPGQPAGCVRGGRAAAALRLVATLAALVAGQALLWRAGAFLPSLRLDGAGSTGGFPEAEPLAAAVGVLRLLSLVVGAGLIAATTFGIVARGIGAAPLVTRLDRWTPPSLRRLLDGALGVGLATSIGISALPASAEPGGRPAEAGATIRRLPDAPTTTLRRLPDIPVAPTEVSQPTVPTTTLERLPDGPPAPAPAPPAPQTPPFDPPAVSPAQPAASRQREVVVQPGESFWLLAARHEAQRLGRSPTENEVGACWQHLVAANRHRLAVPGDPDLLFPGQTLIVPCP